mgnify:FL=1
MATYSVQMPSVQSSVEELMTITRNIQQLISDLESRSESSLAEWEGTVRDTYRAKKQVWDRAAEEMSQAAAKASAQLSQINERYGTAERKGQSLWS